MRFETVPLNHKNSDCKKNPLTQKKITITDLNWREKKDYKLSMLIPLKS